MRPDYNLQEIIFNAYKEERKDFFKIDEVKELGEDSYNEFIKKLQDIPEQNFSCIKYIPKFKKGEAYFLLKKNYPIDYVLTGFYIYPYYVVMKFSDFQPLAYNKHIEAILEDRNIIVQTDNILFLTKEEIKKSAYQGEIDFRPIEKIIRDGNFSAPIDGDIEIRKEFAEMELELTEGFRHRSKFDIYNRKEMWIDNIDFKIHHLPYAASMISENLMGDILKVTASAFALNFILKHFPMSDNVIMEVDDDIIGKIGKITISDSIVYEGILPKTIYIGYDKLEFLNALKDATKITIEE